MTITEHNYEEYFLLYVDDELNSVERNAVEAFVQQHTQYKAVLDGLLQTKLSVDDNLIFINKRELFKNEEKEIGIDNYEDYFLLYTDGELSESDKENIERFVLQHPQLQTEFTLLQQTRLPIDNIEFTGKEKLYKKEKRVAPLYVLKLGIAAVFIGLIAFSWLLIFSNKPPSSAAVVKRVEQKHQVVKPMQAKGLPKKITSDLQTIITQKMEQNKSSQLIIPSIKTKDKKQVGNDVVMNETTVPKLQNDSKNISPENMRNVQQQETLVTENKTAATLKPLEEVSDEETNAQTAFSLTDDNNNVKPAVYKELNTDADDHTLYVGSLQLNKTKVNGILKTASRLFGGRAKQNAE